MVYLRSLSFGVLLCAGLTVPVHPADAAVFTRIVKNYYDISGTTGRELKSQMRENGPKGYWAYTQWYVKWSSHCVVNLKITYTYPRLANRESAPKELVKNWDKMMSHLIAHEEGHGEHGVQAAKEIVEKKCRKAKKITKKWAAQDKSFDRRTNHGAREGVALPD